MSLTRSAGPLRPFTPRRFGRFTLLAPLAAGGMGQIYLARARFAGGLERLCVIKKVLPELAGDSDFAARFQEEAQTLVRLQHGSIAQVYDSGEEEGDLWMALEFVDGKDLRRLLQRLRTRGVRMPLPIAVFVAVKVLEALAYAHRKKDDAGDELGLVHRDVSPQNVLISYEGEVKVIDFGLARSRISSPEIDPAVVMGKFHYMAPEQARGSTIDRRADLYALGVILYEAITGWNPFEDAPAGEVLEWATTPRIPPVQRLAPWVPDALADALHTALQPEPNLRFASAEEMRARLAASLSEIAPDVGPEQLASLLLGEFAEDHERERAWISQIANGLPLNPAEEVTRVAPPRKGMRPVSVAPVRPSSNERDRAAAHQLAQQVTRPSAKQAGRRQPALPWDRDRSGGAGALRSAAAAARSVPRALPWYDNASTDAAPVSPPPEPTPSTPIEVHAEGVELQVPLPPGAGAAPRQHAAHTERFEAAARRESERAWGVLPMPRAGEAPAPTWAGETATRAAYEAATAEIAASTRPVGGDAPRPVREGDRSSPVDVDGEAATREVAPAAGAVGVAAGRVVGADTGAADQLADTGDATREVHPAGAGDADDAAAGVADVCGAQDAAVLAATADEADGAAEPEMADDAGRSANAEDADDETPPTEAEDAGDGAPTADTDAAAEVAAGEASVTHWELDADEVLADASPGGATAETPAQAIDLEAPTAASIPRVAPDEPAEAVDDARPDEHGAAEAALVQPEPTPVPEREPTPAAPLRVQAANRAASEPASEAAAEAASSGGRWRWPVALIGALLVAGGGFWLGWREGPVSTPAPVPAPATEAVEEAVAAPEPPPAVEVEAPAPAPEPPPPPAPEPAPAKPAPSTAPVPAAAQRPRPAPAPAPAPQPAAARAPEPAPAPPRPQAVQRTPDRRTALLAHHAGIMRTWDALIARHGVEQVGPILAGLVQATDSQFRRLIDDPARHEELERQLDELDRLLRERRNAFGD